MYTNRTFTEKNKNNNFAAKRCIYHISYAIVMQGPALKSKVQREIRFFVHFISNFKCGEAKNRRALLPLDGPPGDKNCMVFYDFEILKLSLRHAININCSSFCMIIDYYLF